MHISFYRPSHLSQKVIPCARCQHTPDSVAIFPLFRMNLKAEAKDETPSQQYRLVKWIPAEHGHVGGGKNTLFLGISVSVCNFWEKLQVFYSLLPHQSQSFSSCLSIHPFLESIGRGNGTEMFSVFSLVIVQGTAGAFCSGVLHLWRTAPSWWSHEPWRERVWGWWLAAGPVHLHLLPLSPALPMGESQSLILWL